MLCIDSCVYLSALIPSDPFFQTSQEFLESLADSSQRVVLPSLIPLEVANTLQRQGISVQKASQMIQAFYQTPGTKIVALDQSFTEQVIKLGASFDLKTSDWIVASTCKYFKAQLISWDRSLLKQTKKLLKSQNPQEFLKNF